MSMKRCGWILGTAFVLLLAFAATAPMASGQVAPAGRRSAAPLVLGGSLGSFAGMVGGAMIGVQMDWGGRGEDNIVGALAFASVGAVLGTVLGVELASGGKVPAGRAIGASLAGFAAAAAISYALAETMGDGPGGPIAFSVSQGTVAGLVARVRQRR